MLFKLFIAFLILTAVTAKIYFLEDFNDKEWEKRWTVSTEWKPKSEMGEWKWTAGEFHGDPKDKGIQTGEDSRHYGISAKLKEPFTNRDKELVVQFSVKNEQDLDCGGGYLKLLGDIDQAKFGGDSPYQIMFGPDICGPSNRKTHVIFHYPPKNDNLLIKNEVRVESDRLTHLYTLVVRPDNTFEVFIDQQSARQGTLEEGWDFLLPKTIKDPSVKKPADWVDAKKIPDPEDVKPEGWDDIPAEIPDPEATKPEDWDDEEDGNWEAPMIANPEYKGVWKPKMIPNPAYKGEWVHPTIPNPDYVEDKELYIRANHVTHVGFELWQVKSGTIFDDIIITDSYDEAKEYAAKTFSKKAGVEKEAYEAAEAAKATLGSSSSGSSGDDEDDEHDEL